jgi:hypothetical protein
MGLPLQQKKPFTEVKGFKPAIGGQVSSTVKPAAKGLTNQHPCFSGFLLSQE